MLHRLLPPVAEGAFCFATVAPWQHFRVKGQKVGLNDKKCVWLGVSWGLDLAFLDAD